jgi:hypothetical protein
MYLRSSTIGTSLSRFLSFLADISTCRIGASTTTAGAVVTAWIAIDTLHVLHGLVIIIITGVSSGKVGNFMVDINFLALQQNIDNLSELQVARTEPVLFTVRVFTLGLHPEKVSLGAR